MAKAYVGTARLEPTGFRSPRSRRGWHVRKERQRKRGTTRRSPRRSVHSEGISYKPLSGEIGMCLRVGRMGPQVRMERDRTTRSGARAPGVERQRAARTEVLQRATSPGTERGTDEGSGEHEGQWQTVRGEAASNGKALSDLPALKPYWGKPAVRNFREGNGNVGIIRSPLRAFALPDQSSGFSYRIHSKNHLVAILASSGGSTAALFVNDIRKTDDLGIGSGAGEGGFTCG
jgi:hypothetical protein